MNENHKIVIKLEKELLDYSTRTNLKKLDSLLSDDFYEIGTSGRTYTKKVILDQLSKETRSKIKADNFESIELSLDVIQLRFKTVRKNEDGSLSASLRSSIWKFNNNQWQMIFHQGTRTNP